MAMTYFVELPKVSEYSVRGLKIVKILKYAKFRTSLLNE